MNKVITSFHKYKSLIAISLCSALIVVFLQTLANIIFSPNLVDTEQIYLEEAIGEIVPITQQKPNTQLKSTMQANELKEFQNNGQFKDTLVSQVVNRVDVQLERLIVSFDQSVNTGNNNGEKNVSVNLGGNIDLETSLCATADQNKQSCTIYLVDKSGHSIPIIVSLLSPTNNSQSAITMRLGDIVEENPSIFTGQTVGLDIRVL